VRTDIEHEVAGLDELAVEPSEAPLTQRDDVVDGERTREPDGTVKAPHPGGSLPQALRSALAAGAPPPLVAFGPSHRWTPRGPGDGGHPTANCR
jgi:hypothetical protein